MADEQRPKIASIDELVNELTKKTGNPPVPQPSTPKPPANSQAPQTSRPNPAPIAPSVGGPRQVPVSPPVPKSNISETSNIPKPRFTPPPTGGSMSAPKQTSPAFKAPEPQASPKSSFTAPARQAPGQVKEYQSSFRTMKDDISTLKQGQKPAGVNVPRKVETQTPSTPQTPSPSQAKGQVPQQFRMPSIGLGQAEKSSPLARERISTPLPQSSLPSPVPQKPQIYAPQGGSARSFGGGNSRLYMMIAGIAVIFGVFYWLLVLRQSSFEIVEETPTPTPTATQAPAIRLSQIFSVAEVSIAVRHQNRAVGLREGVEAMTVEGGDFRKLSVGNGSMMTWMEFISVPQQVMDSLAADSLMLAYGQREMFNQAGQINPTAEAEERFVIIAEAKEPSFALQGLGIWEPTMVADFQELFTLDPAKEGDPQFLNNSYQGTAIKYKNFPNPDRSIDYAVVNATNGRSYIVLTNSREAMFAALEVLRGSRILKTPEPTPAAQ